MFVLIFSIEAYLHSCNMYEALYRLSTHGLRKIKYVAVNKSLSNNRSKQIVSKQIEILIPISYREYY